MNNSIAPFDDVVVRTAVSYGTDYDDILENVYKGAMPAGSTAPSRTVRPSRWATRSVTRKTRPRRRIS